MSSFRASVQYDDWEGTAAADWADEVTIEKFLKGKGLMDGEKEFLIGVSLYVGENAGKYVANPFITALIAPAKDFKAAEEFVRSEDQEVNVRSVDVELTLNEFLGLFKRFAVVLTRKGLHLTDRPYNAVA